MWLKLFISFAASCHFEADETEKQLDSNTQEHSYRKIIPRFENWFKPMWAGHNETN